jgi:lipopolysaccharide export system permease protein
MHFASWDKVFDLSAFNFTRTNEDLFKNAYQMMDVKQLSDAIDSFKKTARETENTVSSYLAPYITPITATKESTQLKSKIKNVATALPPQGSFLDSIPADKRLMTLQATNNNVRNLKSLLDNNSILEGLQKENYIKYSIEFHRKFSLSFACMLLFLIGAPLGAIIRKGGIGLPLVFAVVFFITFHLLNTTGEKLAKAGTAPAWVGMWMATFILMPIAIWLIVTARNDSRIFTKEWYVRLIQILSNLNRKKKAVAA